MTDQPKKLSAKAARAAQLAAERVAAALGSPVQSFSERLRGAAPGSDNDTDDRPFSERLLASLEPETPEAVASPKPFKSPLESEATPDDRAVARYHAARAEAEAKAAATRARNAELTAQREAERAAEAAEAAKPGAFAERLFKSVTKETDK